MGESGIRYPGKIITLLLALSLTGGAVYQDFNCSVCLSVIIAVTER